MQHAPTAACQSPVRQHAAAWRPELDLRWPAPLDFEGQRYPSAENALQASKFREPRTRIKFACMPPETAAYNGHARRPTVPGWQNAQYDVLYGILKEKFSDPELKKALLATGTDPIVFRNGYHENGLGACTCPACAGRGQNILGRLLEQVRAECR